MKYLNPRYWYWRFRLRGKVKLNIDLDKSQKINTLASRNQKILLAEFLAKHFKEDSK